MIERNQGQGKEQTESIVIENKELDNAKRTLTMLEKAFERVLRNNYYSQNEWPQIAFEIQEQINTLRGWIHDYQLYCTLASFLLQVGLAMKELEGKIAQLMAMCKPSDGKKRIKKNSKFSNTMNFANQLMPCWHI